MTEKLFVEVRGNGLPLTLLHGYPLDHTIWDDVADKLAKDARVITPDLRGQGRSPAPEGVYSMAELAGDVVQVLDKLGVEKTIIGGHSMGGYVSLALAQLYPERINGLVMVGSHAFADSPEKKKARLDSIAQIKQNGLGSSLAALPDKLSYYPEVREKCRGFISKASPQGIIGNLAGLAAREDQMDIFTQLKVPVMLIAGLDDQINPITMNREMAAKMQKPWLIEIAGAGHMLMLEKPEEVANALKTFITFVKENS